jgi:hypothetical protein
MSADVTIVTAQVDDVVAIPAIALSGTSGSYTVRVITSSGTAETRTVTVGLVTSDLAEIQSGVAAGETIVTGTSADKTATSSSSSSTNLGGLSGIQGGPGAGGPPAGAPGGN